MNRKLLSLVPQVTLLRIQLHERNLIMTFMHVKTIQTRKM